MWCAIGCVVFGLIALVMSGVAVVLFVRNRELVTVNDQMAQSNSTNTSGMVREVAMLRTKVDSGQLHEDTLSNAGRKNKALGGVN